MKTFTPAQLRELSVLAQQAAVEAGQLIQQYRHRELEVLSKNPHTSLAGQVVTEVDHKAQAVILEILQPSLQAYDLALLTEESPDDGSRQQKPAFWCIDPLDGTLPFTQGRDGYSVSIALVAQDGTALLGVVFDPVSETMYHAIAAQGAWSNAKALQIPMLDRTQKLILRTDFSFEQHPWLEATHSGLVQIAQHLGMPGAEIQYRTGAVLNACEILGTPHICYFKYPRRTNNGGSLWDYAASACLYAETGGIATDLFGQALALNRPDSTFMNHKGVLFSADAQLAQGIRALHQQLSA